MSSGTPVTVSVSALCADVKGLLREAYDSLWVSGEVQRLRPNRNGHLFFELVEKGAGDEVVAKLEAVIWRRDWERVRRELERAGSEIVDGGEIRCLAGLDLYAPFGRMQLTVREVDPLFALGKLEARRRQVLAELERSGLLEKNGGLELSPVPLDLALVTSRESAAYHDFLATLGESGYGFRVTLLDAAMQGRAAEGAVASALAAASRLPIDACVLIRGGGSRTDLAAFDSLRVSRAVAECGVPVVTGLGHQIDRAIADLAAHTAVKTPTQAAAFLIDRVAGADRAQAEIGSRLSVAAGRTVERGRHRAAQAEARFAQPRLRLAATGAKLDGVAAALARAAARVPREGRRRLERTAAGLGARAPRVVAAAGATWRTAGERLARSARGRLQTVAARLDGFERVAHGLAPERVLARGFSVTRDASGRAMRSADQIGYGDLVTTRLADGSFRSRVEAGDGE